MRDEVRADPPELGRAARLSLAESQALFDVLRRARDGMPLPPGAVGSTPRSAEVAATYTKLTEAAGTAVERLVAVLEQDVDALYRTAFAYQLADLEAAADFGSLYPYPVSGPV